MVSGLRTLVASALLASLALSGTEAHGAPAAAASPTQTPRVTTGVPLDTIGRVLALSCLLRDDPEEGEAASCSRASHPNGASLALLETASGRIFLFAEATPATDPAEQAHEFLAETVRVRGRLYERAGASILVPERIDRIPAPTLIEE